MEKPAKIAAAARRRDATGHLDPRYATELLAHRKELAASRNDDAFLSSAIRRDPLAEELGEAFIRTATGAEDGELEPFNEIVPEEIGGPFVETTSGVEFAHDTDGSNPRGATREPFPRT